MHRPRLRHERRVLRPDLHAGVGCERVAVRWIDVVDCLVTRLSGMVSGAPAVDVQPALRRHGSRLRRALARNGHAVRTMRVALLHHSPRHRLVLRQVKLGRVLQAFTLRVGRLRARSRLSASFAAQLGATADEAGVVVARYRP
jgi:hypothetical protein